MQQSANREALLGAVESALRELEALCGRLERALMTRRWEDVESAMADSRRMTHALQNAMDDALSVRDAAFDEQIMHRLYYVRAIRQNQMTRLQQYRDAVGERLQLIARWKAAVKSMGRGKAPKPRLSAVDGLT
ncbi:MAG TPA: hypothetical protein VKT72_02995 [Candidatus Baltobacteraceae bacterium]|nr:hypothetical protein [Candidatus Baltobacteraceae bacterium]